MLPPTMDMSVRETAGLLGPMATGGNQGISIKVQRGPPWPGALRSSSLKRQRYNPLGLMVIEPDYVEGFLPATSRRVRKRPRRPTTSPLKLQPLALALTPSKGLDSGSTDHRRSASQPGAGHSPYQQKAQRKHSQQRTLCGGDGGDRNGPVVCGAKHSNDTVISPSLDILTRDYRQDGSKSMVSKAAVVETVASAQSIEKRECGGWAQRRSPSGREDGEGTREEARDTQATKAKLQRMRGSTAVKESEEVIQAGDDVAVNPDPARRHLTSKVRCTTEKFPSGEAFGCCKAVLPMALPGEAHNMSFGAAAKAVVLVSGSSRLLVSRHVRGKRLLSKVTLPWSPPPQPPRRTSKSDNPTESRQQLQQQQLWELHHAALQIQRVWRGYLARAQFWTDGGVGLHAVATRIQRVFRGWRGKIRACKALARKRARAAAVITAIGRGFQGRQEARRLRVARHNAAAVAIQGQFRARAARRWMEQLALASAIRRAGQIQAAWRGCMARWQFRALGLRHSMEEETLKAICFSYTGREGWSENPKSTWKSESAADMVTPMPALPEGFSTRFDCSRPENAGGKSKACIEPAEPAARIERSTANAGKRDPQLAPAEGPLVSKGLASATGSISAQKSKIGGVTEGIFGGAFSPTTASSPDGERLNPRKVAGSVVDTPTKAMSATESQPSPQERYFIAYGHCLLAGAGTGASDEAGEAATAGDFNRMAGRSSAGDFGGASVRARISKSKRARGYGDAVEVFQEGLRRFPTSVVLLYGASLTMQATWFTDGRGGSPTAAMLEASLFLLSRAWIQDPYRRAYQQAEAFFLAAARIARRRLMRAEAEAVAAREAVLAESRVMKELSAAEQAVDGNPGGFIKRLLERPGKETKREEAVGDEEPQEESRDGVQEEEEEEEEQEEPEEVTACKKAAAVATLHVALWSQIANGNHDMDLRRAETKAAYRRAGRLYSRAALLDAAFSVPEVGASERVFEAFYRAKPKLVMTRPLRLQLPPHPEPHLLESFEGGGKDMKGMKSPGLLGSTADPAEDSKQLQQKQWDHRWQEKQQQQQQQREQERQLHLKQQQQQRDQHEEEQRRQHQLIESTLANTPLSITASRPSSPHAVRRIANKVVAVVREGAKIIMRHSPRRSPMSPGATGLGTPAAGVIDGRGRLGNGVAEAKESDNGSRAPAGGEAMESCSAGSSSGNLWKGPANTTTTDGAERHPATFFSEQKIQEKQGQQQGPQRHQEYKHGVDCTNLAVIDPAHTGGANGEDVLMSLTACRQTLEDCSETENAAVTGATQSVSHLPKVFADKKMAIDPAVAKPVGVQNTSIRATVTAWRCGTKLVLRVVERDTADRAGVGETSRAGAGAGPEERADGKEASKYEGEGSGSAQRPKPPLGEGGAIVVVHEAEMERLVIAAIEEQVADGRPRDVLEAKEPFSLVSEYFIGKMVLLPECDEDPRHHFSTSRTIGGRTGGFAVGLGRFAAGLPYLDAIRAQQAEASARDDGARVLQRAFGGLLARSKCRHVCYEMLQVMEEIRQQDRRLLEEDVLRQRESDAARCIQGAWKGWKLRVRLFQLKSAAMLVRKCFRRLEAKRAIEKAERKRLEGPEVLTVYHKGTVVSGIPLMLSVLRCGNSYKFVGRDQEACWAHHGYCYEFEVVSILQQHNLKYLHEYKGDTFMSGRVGPVDLSRTKKIVEMLVSRLALVDALCAPTAELRGQHRYKTLVVQTTDLALTHEDGSLLPSAASGTVQSNEYTVDQKGLRGPGILAVGAEHGRGLRDTRILVAKSLKRFQKRQAKWEETRRKQAYMQHHEKKHAAVQD